MTFKIMLGLAAAAQAAATAGAPPPAQVTRSEPARAQQSQQQHAELDATRAQVEAELRALHLAAPNQLSVTQRAQLDKRLAETRGRLAQTHRAQAAPAELRKLDEWVKVTGTFQPLAFAGLPQSSPADLDIDNAPVADAVRQILERTKLKAELQVDADVPADARVTLRAKNVKANTALDLVAQAAGVHWGVERRNDKTTLRLGKSVRPSHASLFHSFSPQAARGLVIPAPGVPGVPGTASSLDWVITRRSTFTCPHCKGHATVIRQRPTPKCAKCTRTFQPDWQFCPADGSKRPAAAPDWRFCPMCGKRVDAEKSEGDDSLELPMVWDMDVPEDEVLIISGQPVVDHVFRHREGGEPEKAPLLDHGPYIRELFRREMERDEPCLELQQ